ncbi:cobalamin-dependent protein [Candidatus Woesearchaeota archaeon]|nr:cobalamin-dependent protein [Candidatus Woesearchaeota archaeon]
MTDVVLFQPKSDLSDESVSRSISIPLSLLQVASFLHKKHSIVLIDQRIEKNWKNRLLTELKKKPLFFGTTCYTGEPIKWALEASKIAKTAGIPVVWGGIHATLLPEQALANENIDIVAYGEGENTLVSLADHFLGKRPINDIKGIYYKSDSSDEAKIIKNPPAQPTDLNKLGPLPTDIINVNRYINNKTIGFASSRGCPFSCTFCINVPIYGRKYHAMSADNTFEQAKFFIEKFKITYLLFLEADFFIDKKKAWSLQN